MNNEQYRNYLGAIGGTKRDRVVYKSRNDISKLAKDNPSYKQVQIDGVAHYISVISTGVTNQKIIEAMPGDDFNVGSILIWNGSHWLITERDLEDDITVRGRIEICKREIVWQDKDTLEILRRWITADKPYYSNLDENKTITYSTREFKLQVPYDEQTAKLELGKRLMMEIIAGEPKTYRITSIDQITDRVNRNGKLWGFININIEQDAYNAAVDNVELMICNYIEPKEQTEPDSGDDEGRLKITYNNAPTIRLGGVGTVFYAFYDDEQDYDTSWSISSDDSIIPNKICFKDGTEAYTGKACKLICISTDTFLVGKSVVLTASSHGETVSINVEVVTV